MIMSTILNNVKGVCDLMMHGTLESSTPNVRSAFDASLRDYLLCKTGYIKDVTKGPVSDAACRCNADPADKAEILRAIITLRKADILSYAAALKQRSGFIFIKTPG